MMVRGEVCAGSCAWTRQAAPAARDCSPTSTRFAFALRRRIGRELGWSAGVPLLGRVVAQYAAGAVLSCRCGTTGPEIENSQSAPRGSRHHASHPPLDGVPCETLLHEMVSGRVGDVIAEQARACDYQFIVTGIHGRLGVSRLVVGSDATIQWRTRPVPMSTDAGK